MEESPYYQDEQAWKLDALLLLLLLLLLTLYLKLEKNLHSSAKNLQSYL